MNNDQNVNELIVENNIKSKVTIGKRETVTIINYGSIIMYVSLHKKG